MSVLAYAAPAAVILAPAAADVLKDSARQRREDRQWREVRGQLSDLEEEEW